MQEVSVGDEQWHLFRWGHGRGGAIRKSSIKSCRLWSAFGLNGHGDHMVHISETFAVAQPGVLGPQRW